ncbi:MAG: hypothetical protein NTZ68_01905 [Candidatus Dependentiae bacterium]|nr:hypothetical protein [Candidatus Dependentiae bacterium]
MASFLGGIFNLGLNRHERLKFILLTISFAFVLGSYTIAKELKDSIFVSIVGKDHLPMAKLLVIFLLIPAALVYSRLVDVFRRYQLLAFYSMLYGVILAGFAVLLGHHSIGLYNAETSPYRLFGWIFYFFLEGYSPFVVGVFWAFANSVTSPNEAKNCYPVMVAGSKIGGIFAALFAWYILDHAKALDCFGCVNHDVVSHQILMGLVSVMLLCVPVILTILMRTVPGQYLHGYEAVYQLEKQQDKEKESDAKTGMFSGIKLLVQSPYVLGIFGLVFFYETLNVVIGLQRIGILKEASTSVAGFTASMFWQRFQAHFYGMIISFFGVQFLLRRFELRRCLFLVPFLISGLLIFFVFTYSVDAIMYLFIGMSTVNYSISYQLRESLYIPTSKDMKFKAKAWIDTFGTKFSKGFGCLFSNGTRSLAAGTTAFTVVYGGFFSLLMLAWFITSWLLGKKYEKAIRNNEIIGNE